MKKVFIDSDLFVRDLRYPRDARTEINSRFLNGVRTKKISGVTSLFNLLEVCGILSYNLTPQDLLNLYASFTQHYNLQLLFPADQAEDLEYDLPKIFEQIQKKQALGDAQISYVVDQFANHIRCFVSWNAAHFRDKMPIPALTPEEFLNA